MPHLVVIYMLMIHVPGIGTSVWDPGPFFYVSECQQRLEKNVKDRKDYGLEPADFKCWSFYRITFGAVNE